MGASLSPPPPHPPAASTAVSRTRRLSRMVAIVAWASAEGVAGKVSVGRPGAGQHGGDDVEGAPAGRHADLELLRTRTSSPPRSRRLLR